jgi:hypothetical protein
MVKVFVYIGAATFYYGHILILGSVSILLSAKCRVLIDEDVVTSVALTVFAI